MSEARAGTGSQAWRVSFPAMGTRVEIAACGGDQRVLTDIACREVADLEDLLSRFRENSDISRINRAAERVALGACDSTAWGGWVDVHPLTAHILRRAVELSEETDVAFTPLIGPLVDLWDARGWLREIAATARIPAPPNEAEIEAARALCRPNALEMDGGASHTRVRLRRGSSLDLGGIAKGWTADRVRDLCVNGGAHSVLVSVGTSSIAVYGQRPTGGPWKVGVRALDAGVDDSAGFVELEEGSLSTSGDNLQRLPQALREALGEGTVRTIVPHILDPLTGQPAPSTVRTAVALANEGMKAEAYSTALRVRGEGACARAAHGVKWLLLNEKKVWHHPDIRWHLRE